MKTFLNYLTFIILGYFILTIQSSAQTHSEEISELKNEIRLLKERVKQLEKSQSIKKENRRGAG